MRKIPLAKSNPFLRSAADLKAFLLNAVATSTAIEGVHGVLPEAYKPAGKKNSGAFIARERAASYRSRR